VILTGRVISPGYAEGKLLLLHEDFSFLGGVDVSTGRLRTNGGESLVGRVFAFPRGKGSTVGSYTLFDLKTKGLAPAAIINSEAETIVTTGAVISSIPLVDRLDLSLFCDGDNVRVDGYAGTVELTDVRLREVVTGIIVRDGKILGMERSNKVKYFKGKWGGVSGSIEKGESPLEAAVREAEEETGLHVRLLRRGESFFIRDGNIMWNVYPMLFEAKGEPVLNWEHFSCAWLRPEELLARDTVPRLDEVLRRLGQIL